MHYIIIAIPISRATSALKDRLNHRRLLSPPFVPPRFARGRRGKRGRPDMRFARKDTMNFAMF